VKTIEQNLRPGSMLPYQVHVGGPHVHAHHLQGGTTPSPQFCREKLPDRFFRPVFAYPQQDSSLQIVDHREVNLSLTAADFIDADDMHGRPLTIPQTIAHRVLHDSCHRLPVQPVLPGGTFPAQFSGQTGARICPRPGPPPHGFGPRTLSDRSPTGPTLHSSGLITYPQAHLSHRQISPFPLFPHTVHLRAWLPAYSTPQPPIPQAVDGNHHLLFASFDFGHAVGFQAQLFSDKRFDEHLVFFSFLWIVW